MKNDTDSSTPFERYQTIIDDWAAFQTSITCPLPTCIWTNTLRTTPDYIARLLTTEGIPFEPLTWYPGAFKLDPSFKSGRHWAFLAGLYHTQEEVALLPVTFIDPQPGERILDLCAAPGNKTGQMAVKMVNRGTIVANDIQAGRMRALRQTLERLGVVSVATTTSNGGNYPKAAGLFDKVLVDVPCSCEGTSRKTPAVMWRTGKNLSLRKSGNQRALLRKAVQLCKPGGRIVYATCTFAPEENEMVVDAILREFGPDILRIVPAHLAGFSASEGLTHWRDQQFEPTLRHTMRIWPHQNDTGGFYVAVLEKQAIKLGGNNHSETPALEDSFSLPSPTVDVVGMLNQRFGIEPSCFEANTLFQPSKRRAYIVANNPQPPRLPKPDAIGMMLMKTAMKYPKFTTAAALHFGVCASQNVVDLSPLQVEAYINRRSFEITASQNQSCTGIGYILVRYQGFILGVADYRPAETGGGGQVKSLFPKGWSPNKG